MPTTIAEIRSGAYYDSIVLMQLQRSLAALPGVIDAGVVMGTEGNKEILRQSALLVPEVDTAGAEDLILVIRADDDDAARAALGQVDVLLSQRQAGRQLEFRPKSLDSAAQMMPGAQWVLVSVAGRYAGAVARQALRLGKSVFLYSDNVPLQEEVELKQMASEEGLLVMGPDCGTAIVNGVGLGFANRVRRGPIGLVAASGTGLQQISARLHQLGTGITHALGTGGRDLSQAVGAITAHQALDLFRRDAETRVIVLVSKPPAPAIAEALLQTARAAGKPIVVELIGYAPRARQVDNLYFAASLDEAAELAAKLASPGPVEGAQVGIGIPGGVAGSRSFAPGQRYLRGLYSGGTLAYEALLLLQDYLPAVYSNAPLSQEHRLPNSLISQGHTVVDLGEDEFTVGRLHPMMDNDLRIHRLYQEAQDPEVAVLLIDLVLGYGVHPDPAGELAPAIARATAEAKEAGRHLEVVAVVVGTDEDPQDMQAQMRKLEEVGVHVETSSTAAVRYAGGLARSLDPAAGPAPRALPNPVDLAILKQPLAAINVGLESFAQSLESQGAPVLQVDWRPPAGGNERLMAILERMRR